MSSPSSDRRVISGHPTLERPAPPRIDRRSEDRETASTSATSEEFDDRDFFDWDRWHADGGQETDVTTHSEVSAEGEHVAASPSDVFPVSVGGTLSDSDGDIHMTDVVWPAVDPAQPPRAGRLSIEGQGGPSRPSPPPTDFPVIGQHQNMHQRRSRVLGSPEETSQVRDAGACYHCRMNKSRCGLGVCEWCKKQPFPELACIRRPMPAVLGSTLSRWNFTEILRRDNLDERQPQKLLVSFTSKADSPCLEVTVAPFHGDQASVRFGIMSSATPSEQKLLEWAKAQMDWENKYSPDFDSRLNLFHIGHVGDRTLERSLLPNLLKMKQMWKIWSCKAFFVQQPGSAAKRQFGSEYSSIQDCLRHIAGRVISQHERSIIKDVEDYLKKDKTVAPSNRAAVDISKWLSLWQLISIYRHSLRSMLQQEHTDAAPLAVGVTDGYGERRRSFRNTTTDLLRGIVVIYYDLFHKRTTIHAIRDSGPEVFNKSRLYDAFRHAVSANSEYYQEVLKQNLPADQFFIEYLIKRELKTLSSRRR